MDSGGGEMELREQDKWLPIANVYRIMKNALPKNAKVSKEAKECVQECVSEFVSFITSEASDRCSTEKRKTVNGEDILFAMTSLGFENYAEVLKIYLTKYREYLSSKEKAKRGGSAGSQSELNSPSTNNGLINKSMDNTSLFSDTQSISGPSKSRDTPEPDTEVGGQDEDERFSYASFDGAPDEALYDEYQGQFTNDVDMGEFDRE